MFGIPHPVVAGLFGRFGEGQALGDALFRTASWHDRHQIEYRDGCHGQGLSGLAFRMAVFDGNHRRSGENDSHVKEAAGTTQLGSEGVGNEALGQSPLESTGLDASGGFVRRTVLHR